jgi:hypothetical protein
MTGSVEVVDGGSAPPSDRWVRAWPLRKPALLHLARGGLLVLVVTTGIGLLFMAFLDDGPVGDADRAGAEWLAERRTPTWNAVTDVGSALSDTLVKVILDGTTQCSSHSR